MEMGTGGGKDGGQVVARRRSVRSDKDQIRLNARDLRVLPWIGQQYAVRMDQLRRILGRLSEQETQEPGQLTEQTAERVVRRWLKDGLAERRKYLHREPAWVWLSRRGLEQMGLERYRVLEPKVALLNHYYWVNQVRLYVEGRRDEAAWRSERELRQPGGGRVVQTSQGSHYADAEVELPNTIAAVEVELTVKKRERLREIVLGLADVYGTVWYFTNRETRPVVTEVCEALPETLRRRIRIYNLEDTL